VQRLTRLNVIGVPGAKITVRVTEPGTTGAVKARDDALPPTGSVHVTLPLAGPVRGPH
jgi:hypothetical protein